MILPWERPVVLPNAHERAAKRALAELAKRRLARMPAPALQGEAPRLSREARSWVYFIQCGDQDGPIKIGVANNVHVRLADLQCACPYQLTLLGFIPGNRETERELHKYFGAFRGLGEWFRADKTVRFSIQQMLRTYRQLRKAFS